MIALFLINFLPERFNYVRRWVRVPLGHGPIENPTKDDGVSKFKSVAVDWTPPENVKLEDSKIVVLLLAGLTGGSEEGYVVDLVARVRAKGWHSFVMLGRGLARTPCQSDAFFHGARTCDFRATAQMLRRALPRDTKIVAVGVSMGGIIVNSACVRGELDGLCDAAISVSGCNDTNLNVNFLHSRKVWQPVLAHGLKEAFTESKSSVERMERKVGSGWREILGDVKNVKDFDNGIAGRFLPFLYELMRL